MFKKVFYPNTSALKQKNEVVLILLDGTFENLNSNFHAFSFPTLHSLCKIIALCLLFVLRVRQDSEVGWSGQSFLSSNSSTLPSLLINYFILLL